MSYSHCRWCDFHQQYHGILYPCKSYTKEILAVIKSDRDKHVGQLCDGEWVATQINKGVDPLAIEISKIFAGL